MDKINRLKLIDIWTKLKNSLEILNSNKSFEEKQDILFNDITELYEGVDDMIAEDFWNTYNKVGKETDGL